MKRCLLISSLFILCSFQVSILSFTDMHVMKAAEGQMNVFLSRIAPGESNLYGFRQQDDLETVVVERPYRIIEFNMDFYDNELREDQNYITLKNEWRVPLSVGGAFRTMLFVSGGSANFKVTNMGDTSLARELQSLNRGISDSDEYYLLRIPALSACFFVHAANSSFVEGQFVPLSSGFQVIGKPYSAGYTLNEVQQLVKDEMRKKVKREQENKLLPEPKKAPVKKKTTTGK